MAYLGTPIDTRNQFQSLQGKRFNGDGSTTDFTLDVAPSSTLDIEVFVGNVRQDPNSAYTLSGTTLTFTGAPPSGTNNIYVVHQAKAVGTIDLPEGALVDLNGGSDKLVLDADGDTTISADTDDQIDIKIAGADDFKFTANNMNVLSGSTLTIDSGATITNNGTANGFGALAGIDDQSSSNDDQLTITDTAVVINEDSDDVDFRYESNEKTHHFFLDGGTNDGAAAFGDDAPETGTGGITLNQTSLDNLILSMKSNDIAHGVTNHQETDTYMGFLKYHATSGGGNITGISEDDVGMFIHGFAPNPNTTQNATGVSVVMMRANDVSGAGGANVGSTGNCFGVQNGGSQVFIVRGDGNIYSDSSHNTYDAFDDAQLVRAFDLSHGKGVIDSKFDKFVSYNHEKLAELDLVGRENDGTPNHFVNVTGMQRLHNGAIWQQYEKHNQLLEAVYDLAKEAVGKEKADAILEKHDVKRLQ